MQTPNSVRPTPPREEGVNDQEQGSRRATSALPTLPPAQAQNIPTLHTPEELAFVSRFKTGEVALKAGAPLFLEGAASAHLYTVLSGLAFRYKLLPDGRRQILNYCMPGDFIGLQGSVMHEMQHSVEALSDMVLCVFNREGLWRLFENHAGLSFDVTWLAVRSEQTLGR